MRKDARDAVYKLLFANMFNKGLEPDFIKFIYDENKLQQEDRTFADNLLQSALLHNDEICEFLSAIAENYHIDRIFAADKCALILAMTEMKYFNDIPLVVSIDEAVSLVSKYSTEKSLSFVNGVLGEYKRRLEAENVGTDN